MTSPAHNFVLCGRNTASRRGALSTKSEVVGGEVENLLNFERSSRPWITANAGPHATEVFVTYSEPVSTRALSFDGGRLPVHATSVRVCRGSQLTPTLVLWAAETANVNAVGALDRVTDPRTSVPASFVGPATPSQPWSVTLSFAPPEFGWSPGPDQKLVVVAQSSVAGGDGQLTVEARDATSTWVLLGQATVTQALGGAGDTPRFSFRLASSELSTPAEVRISGSVGSVGAVRLHGLVIVSPVNPANQALRLRGGFLSTQGGIAGDASQTRHNPLDPNIAGVAGVEMSTSPAAAFRAAIDSDPRPWVSADLLFSWQPGSIADVIEVKLFHSGTEIATLGSFSTPDLGIRLETVSMPLGGLPEPDAVGLELEFSRPGGIGNARISGVAVHVTFAESSEPTTYDSGWRPIQSAPSSDLTGGLAIDTLGRPVDVAVPHDYRLPNGRSTAVVARQTFVDFAITRDPSDADRPLVMDDQPRRAISFRTFFEGPGLAEMKLAKGIRVEYIDTSIKKETLGGLQVVLRRRIYRRVSFQLSDLPPGVGPEQVAQLLYRAGQTEPVLFIVLPDVPGISTLFSLFGLVDKDPAMTHTFAQLTEAKMVIREL